MNKRTGLAFLIALAPLLTWAHPGHGGTDGWTIIHYFVEWPHAVLSWTVVLLIVIVTRYLWREEKRQNADKDA